jgi:hypothetical protein
MQVFIEQMKTAIHPPVHPLWIELEKIINSTVEKAMYGESVDRVFADAALEYKRISERKESNRIERAQEAANAKNGANGVNGSGSGSGSTQIVLLVLIAVGTIINAILLSFLLIEVKKNAR